VWKVDLKYERVERVAMMQGIEGAVAWSGAGKRYAIASSDRLLAGKFSLKAIDTEGIYSRKSVITALPASFFPVNCYS
jgi:Tol biopolymer transport system component